MNPTLHTYFYKQPNEKGKIQNPMQKEMKENLLIHVWEKCHEMGDGRGGRRI